MGIVVSNAVSQAKHLQLSAGEHILTGSPTASSTKALLRLGGTIDNGSANGTWLGISVPLAFAGDIIRAEIETIAPPALLLSATGAGVARLGIGGTATARKLEVRGSANDTLDAAIGIVNITNGTAAGVQVNLVSGTAPNAASGMLACFSASYTAVAALADRLCLVAASDASGIVYSADNASQDHRWLVATLGEQMRLDSVGLGLGQTTIARRLDILGTGNNVTSGAIRVQNSNNGTAAGAVVDLVSNTSSGTIAAYPAAYTGVAALADRVAIVLGSDASGLSFYAPGASQDIRMHADNSGAETGRWTTTGLAIGKTASIAYKLEVLGTANDLTSGGMRLANSNNGTASGTGFVLEAADSSGFFRAFPSGYTANANFADCLVLGINSDATAMVFDANGSGQNMRFRVGTLGEQMRLSEAGELLIGTTSSLARYASLARADQIQQLVRAFSSQSANIAEWQDNGGTARVRIGSLTQTADPTLTLRAITSQSGAMLSLRNASDGTTYSIDANGSAGGLGNLTAGVLPSSSIARISSFPVSSGIGLAIRGASGQTGNLQEWQVNGPVTVGFVAASGATSHTTRDAGTSAIVTGLTIGHNSTGTPAAGFGTQIQFTLESTTTEDRAAAELSVEWATATDASRKARLKLTIYDTAVREVLRGEADGSNPMLGFLGAAAIARPSTYTLAGSATRTFPTDPSSSYTGIDNAQAGTVYAKVADLNTLRGVVSSLEGVVRQVVVDLASTSGYGLLVAS